MARARNIKPALFLNEILGVADPLYTLAFEGLWLLADREGRLEDRPLRIKAEIFPYREKINMDAILDWLQKNEFIIRYSVDNKKYILILNFKKHQNPHKNEKGSVIPPPKQEPKKSEQEPKKSEPLGLIPDSGFRIPDSLIPDSLIPDNAPSSKDEEAPRQPLLKFPLNKKGTFFYVYHEDVAEWQESFPGIDAMLELKKCRQWSIDNPTKRKTKGGIRKHISGWLGRAQDNGRLCGKGKPDTCIPSGAENAI